MSERNRIYDWTIAGLVGVCLAVGFWQLRQANSPDPVEPEPEVDEAPLAGVTPEPEPTPAEELGASQARVAELEASLAGKEAELERFQADRAAGRERAAAHIEALEREVAALRVQLSTAEAERDQLRGELRQALADLDAQVLETEKARTRARRFESANNGNLWAAFSENAKVRICDRGTRKRHERCHEAVSEALDSALAADFIACVSSQQAVPVLMEGGREMPTHARALPDNRYTRGWYVNLCDPTLPQAPGLVESEPVVFAAAN